MSDYQGNIIIKNPATPTGPNQNGSAPGVWKLSEALGFIRQGIWPTQGVGGPDVYFPYVSLLLSTTALGNASNNLFVDSSGAFNPISRSGNATQGSVTPYSANWSNYFDGSGDYLQTSGVNLALGSGAWTIEGWIYLISYPGSYAQIYDSRFDSHGTTAGLTLYVGSTGTLRVYQGTDRAYTSATISRNTWTHFAAVYDGTTLKLYLNGSNTGATNYTTSFNLTNTTMQIAAEWTTTAGFINAYISNFRIVKGTAVYTNNFTPPTSALTAISGTSLLTCQSNRFRDASANNYTLTRFGDTRVTDFSPFSPSAAITYNQSDITNWSNYFDGNGDYLTVPSSSAFNYGTGDFTIECWGYRGSSSNFWCGYSASGVSFTLFSYSGASSTIQVYSSGFYDSGINPGYNTWFHVAVTRSSGTLRIFINGVQGFSGSYTTDIASHSVRIGASTANEWGLGNVSNLRVVKGTALYTSNFTPPTTNLTAVSGTSLLTCQSAAFTDNSTNNFVITPTGEVTVTGNSPFNTVGYWSNYFDGSSTITFNSISLAGDFTIEGWVYFIGTNNPTVLGANPPNNQSLRRLATGKHYFYRQGVDITGTIDVPLNQWVHLAATRSGGTVRIFTNGVLDGSNTITGTFSLFCLGGVDTGTDRLTGYTSNMRVVDGTALYTATFTPPTAPLTAVSGTVLLTSQNGNFKDNSTNNLTLTRNGSPQVQSFDPFYTSTIASNGGSMYFDGSGDYLAVASNAALPTGNARYTIEAWIYPTAINTNNGVIGWGTYGTTNAVNAIKITSTQIFNYWWANDLTGNFTFTAGQWYHIVAQFDGTTRSLYVNGTRLATDTPAGHNVPTPVTNATIGVTNSTEYFTGYIAGAKVTSGAALYSGASYTVPTAPATPAASTTLLLNGMNAGIYDATTINDMETVGNAQVTTAVSKFGGSSLRMLTASDYVKGPLNPLMAFGTGDFTIEAWVYSVATTSLYTCIFTTRDGTTSQANCVFFGLKPNTNQLTFYTSSEIIGTTTAVTTGVWTHVALVRSSGTTVIYINGVNSGSATFTTSLNGQGVAIGNEYSAASGNGGLYVDDLRITNGYARYTSNFTPPTQAFPTF